MNVRKHAYLIIAHNEPNILQTLVNLIDDERNDIFIHIDSKAEFSDFNNIKANHSNLIFTERISCNWGDISLVQCEYILIETAYRTGSYSYYHLLSGVDLPIKTQNQIHNFFWKNQGKEFIGYATGKNTDKDIKNRISFYYYLIPYLNSKNILLKKISRYFLKYFTYIQKKLRVKRHKNIEFKKGCEWFSITGNLVKHLIENKKRILSLYNHSFCSDELFLQTEVWNSPFKNNLYNVSDEFEGCMRYIDWNRGKPYVWKLRDLEELKNSDKLFARKFSSKNYDIIKEIEKYILHERNSI